MQARTVSRLHCFIAPGCAADFARPSVACVSQSPLTAAGLLGHVLRVAACAMVEPLRGHPTMSAQELWGAVAFHKDEYHTLANTLGWLVQHQLARAEQLANTQTMQCMYDIAAMLHAVVKPALSVQPEALGSAKDAAAATAVAAAATALICFAEVDCSGSSKPDPTVSPPGGMQIAAVAASFLHSLARQLQGNKGTAAPTRSALASAHAVVILRQLLSWFAKPAGAVAMSSAVLTEALPALAAMAEGDEEICRQLAAEGGPHEWAPVEAALRRRLPRRMAARFLPQVDCVTTAIAKASTIVSFLGALQL